MENSGHISAAAVAAVRVIARFLDVAIPNSPSGSVGLPSKGHSKTVSSETKFPNLPFNASPERKTKASRSNDKGSYLFGAG